MCHPFRPADKYCQVVVGYDDGSVLLVDLSRGCQLASWAVHSPAAVQSMQWLAAAASLPAPQACQGSFINTQENEQNQQQQQQDKPAQGATGNVELEHCQQQQQQQGQAEQDDQLHEAVLRCQQPGQNALPGITQQEGVKQQQALHAAVHGSGQCHFLLTAGADRSVKLWKLSAAAAAGQPDPAGLGHQDMAAAAADEALPAAGSGANLGPVTTAGTGLSTELLAAAQLDGGSTAAAVAGGRGDGSSGSSGSHAGRHYGAVAAVPGSLSSSGSCLVTAAGPLGSLLLVHLMPGQHRQYILLTAWCRCNHLQMVVGSLKR